MMKRVASLALLASAIMMSSAALAAPNWQGSKPVPMFAVGTDHSPLPYAKGQTPPPAVLQTWSGGFTDLKGHSVTFKMVGQDPASSNTDTHIQTVLIPVIMVYGASNGNMTFDPRAKHTGAMGRKSVMKALLASPMFDPGADFMSGAIDCGQSQYIDAYQRCNFWSSVQTNTNYHVILDVIKIRGVRPLTINVSASQGSVISNPFGSGVVGTDSISSFDAQLASYLTSHANKITPDIFPFFVSYDIYLTQGGCCIGGYHSARGAQSYGYTTYVDSSGAFSEDIGAVSHEVGEWLDDPFTNNHVFCTDNSILENGDPLVPFGQYGTFTQSLNGKTWHPQELVFLPYFGAPVSTSANSWYSLHNTMTHVCPGQN